MVHVRKFVRFCFGLEALCLISTVLMFLVSLLRLRISGFSPIATNFALQGTLLLALSVPPGIAWWTLRKGIPAGRLWAFAASVCNLPIPLPIAGLGMERPWTVVFHLFRIPAVFGGSLLGIAGLLAFARKQDAADVAESTVRLPGDGTSKLLDVAAYMVSVAMVAMGSFAWDQWRLARHLELPSFWVGLCWFELAILLTASGHECGHIFAGWLSEMKLRSLQVGPLRWAMRNGRWTFHAHPSGILGGGGVAMVPTHLARIRSRRAFMILGGPVASLLIASTTTLAALTSIGHPWSHIWALLCMMSVISSMEFIMNLMPTKPGHAYSDGAKILQLARKGPWASIDFVTCMVAASAATTARPRDWNLEAIRESVAIVANGREGLGLRLFAAMHCVDAGLMEEAVGELKAAEEIAVDPRVRPSADTCAEFVFLNVILKQDATFVERWWAKLSKQRGVERDADYWKASACIAMARRDFAEAGIAVERGAEMSRELPAWGLYDYTRGCFDLLREALKNAPPAAPPVYVPPVDELVAMS